MRVYGLLPKEVDNIFVRKGDYQRYGHSKRYRTAYLKCERAVKRRERNDAKMQIKKECESIFLEK